MLVLDQGGLFNDVQSAVWLFNTHDGFLQTTAEELAAFNLTASAENGDVITLTTYLRSMGNTRLFLFVVFVMTSAWSSIFHPTECAILRNAARRSVFGGSEEAVGTTREDGEGDEEERAPGLQQCIERIELDAESEATVAELQDDGDKVIVFIPAEEIIIPEGPKRSVLCFLLNGNHHRAKSINDFLDDNEISDALFFVIFIASFLPLAVEALPLDLTWIVVLLIPDVARALFMLNLQAVKLAVSEPFNFIVPCVALAGGLVGFAASFDYHPG